MSNWIAVASASDRRPVSIAFGMKASTWARSSVDAPAGGLGEASVSPGRLEARAPGSSAATP